MRKGFLLFKFIAFTFLFSCGTTEEANRDSASNNASLQNDEVNANFAFHDSAVTLPSPASVKLDPDGRFHSRYAGNINYVCYQHEHYGQGMLEAFASRHYSPGKLLERMWDGEYAGKWLDGATRTAVNTGNMDQLEMVDAFALSLKNYQQQDGYMGIKLPTDRDLDDWETDWDLWNQWNSMIGFLTHYEFRGVQSSLDAASAIGKWIVNSYGPVKGKNSLFFKGSVNGGFTNVVVIGQLIRLYRHTGDEEMLEFVRQVIQYYPPLQEMLSNGEPFLVHPYMLGAVLLGVVEFAEVTNDYDMLEKVEQVWAGLASDHLFPTGSMGEREDLDSRPLEDEPDGQLQETCATTEWIFLTQRLYEVTGRIKYIEALEQTSYNALLAAQSEDGMKWCYWTPLRYSKHWFHGPTRCCFWSGPRGIARIPQLIYATRDDIIYINFFESSHAILATANGEVYVGQDSKFPESGRSEVTLKAPHGWKGKLRIRVPGWSSDFKANLDGKNVPHDSGKQNYIEIDIRDSTEYVIQVTFDVPIVVDRFTSGKFVIRRGPEILAIDVRDNIDTWLGAQDELVSVPEGITIRNIEALQKYQWPGPSEDTHNRRRYRVDLEDQRTSEPRSFILTPYADAGNEGAAFLTVFPMAE